MSKRTDIKNSFTFRAGDGPGVWTGDGVTTTDQSPTLFVSRVPRGILPTVVKALFEGEEGFVAFRTFRHMCFVDFDSVRNSTRAMRKYQSYKFPDRQNYPGIAIDYDKDIRSKRNRRYEEQKENQEQAADWVQYCLCCGSPIFRLVGEESVSALPNKRSTDGATAAEFATQVRDLYAAQGETKLIKREKGIERQCRINCKTCDIPFAYMPTPLTEPSKFMYVFPGAAGGVAERNETLQRAQWEVKRDEGMRTGPAGRAAAESKRFRGAAEAWDAASSMRLSKAGAGLGAGGAAASTGLAQRSTSGARMPPPARAGSGGDDLLATARLLAMAAAQPSEAGAAGAEGDGRAALLPTPGATAPAVPVPRASQPGLLPTPGAASAALQPHCGALAASPPPPPPTESLVHTQPGSEGGEGTEVQSAARAVVAQGAGGRAAIDEVVEEGAAVEQGASAGESAHGGGAVPPTAGGVAPDGDRAGEAQAAVSVAASDSAALQSRAEHPTPAAAVDPPQRPAHAAEYGSGRATPMGAEGGAVEVEEQDEVEAEPNSKRPRVAATTAAQ